VDLALGLDLQALKDDSTHRALRRVAHRHAGVECRNEMLLRIGELVRPAQLKGFIDVDREPARDLLTADFESLHLPAGPRLALPGGGDAPVRLGLCGVFCDALYQSEQIVDIDAVYDDGLGLGNHDWPPVRE